MLLTNTVELAEEPAATGFGETEVFEIEKSVPVTVTVTWIVFE
jgi:hypothetical protein